MADEYFTIKLNELSKFLVIPRLVLLFFYFLFSFLFCLDFVFDFIFLSTALGVKLLTIIYYYSSENRFLRLMMLAYRLCIYLFSRSD